MRSIFLHAALLGLLLVASGQQQATDFGEQLLRDGRLLFDSAHYYEALTKGSEAVKYFQKAPHKDAMKEGEALVLMGDVFLEQGEFDAAEQQYQEAISVFGKKAEHLLLAKALNGLGEYHYQKSDFKAAEAYHRKALVLREKQSGAGNEEVADSYNNIGNCFAATGRYAEALDMHQKALDIRQQTLPAGHPAFAVSHSNIGACLYHAGDYAGALSQFEAALKIRLQTFGADHPKMALLYNNLGNCYVELGRADLALQHYEQSLSIRRQHFGEDHPSIAAVLENLGDLNVGNGDYIAALDYFRDAHAILSRVQGESSLSATTVWHKIGLCFQYQEDYEQALQNHLQAERIFLSELGPNHPRLAELYSNMGNCYADNKEPGQAETYYQKSLNIFKKAYPDGHPSIAQAYNNLGFVFLEQKKYHDALAKFQDAEKSLLQFPADQERNARLAVAIKNMGLARAGLEQWQPALADCERALQTLKDADMMTALELLSGQAVVLKKYALIRQDWSLLRTAAASSARALNCLDSLRMQMTSSDTRLHWVTRKYSVLGEALETNFILWEKTGEEAFLETAFSIAERGKSLQLIENLRKEQAERFAGIPDSLLAKERALKAEVNRWEKERLAAQQRQNTEEEQFAESALAFNRRTLAALIADFEANFPDYFRLKYSGKTATLKSVRNDFLHADQALSAYFATDSFIFAFVITGETFKGVRIPADFPLGDWIDAMRSSIEGYATAGSALADSLSGAYVSMAVRLYQKVVAPLEKAGLAGQKYWTIVPDGKLADLPFEALLREMPKVAYRFKSHAYLLRDYCISYAYSATQLGDLLAHPYQKPSRTLAAFAPDFKDNREGLSVLRHNGREARNVGAMFGGDILEGEAASAEAFLRDAGHYRMLLLATHGKASSVPEEPSYLAFSPAKSTGIYVYVKDLYQLRLPAELVVLSACQTNLGEYKVGEGVISLAKGFFHAGVRSMVATLWSVDDAKNADLMLQFFQQIRKGMPKDAALQQAKLNHLSARPHDEAHPFFWAAAVATGDMAAMDFSSPWRWVFYGAAVMAAGIGVLWFKRRQ